MSTLDHAVILARGLGTRMRQHDPAATLGPSQSAVADAGVKALISVGRPFLDYVLAALAESGYRRICLVIGPEHDAIRSYYAQLPARRLSIHFAIQERPLGTADAVAAAESFAADQPFIVLNSDNLYPPPALELLRAAPGPALVAFDPGALVAYGNIAPDRIARFAVIETTPAGHLRRIIEKPDPATLASLPRPLGVSMNCWRFDPAIFAGCRAITPSPRGELEITAAVQYSIDHLHQCYTVQPCAAGVLDLSSRADIEPVTRLLQGRTINL